jgi:hypothetical protein
MVGAGRREVNVTVVLGAWDSDLAALEQMKVKSRFSVLTSLSSRDHAGRPPPLFRSGAHLRIRFDR